MMVVGFINEVEWFYWGVEILLEEGRKGRIK